MLAGGVFWCIFAGNPTCTFENMDDDTSIEFGSSMVIRMRDIGCTRYVRDTLTLSDRHTGLQDVCTEFSNHVLVKNADVCNSGIVPCYFYINFMPCTTVTEPMFQMVLFEEGLVVVLPSPRRPTKLPARPMAVDAAHHLQLFHPPPQPYPY